MRKRFTTEQIRFTDEQIIGILLAEIGAMSIKVLCKKHDLTEQTFSAGATSSATWMYPRPRARERLAEAGGGRADAGHRRVEGDHPKKTPPSERRGTVQVLVHRGLSQRETRRYRGLSLTRSFDAPLLAMGDRPVLAHRRAR